MDSKFKGLDPPSRCQVSIDKTAEGKGLGGYLCIDEPHRGMDTDNGPTSALDGVIQLADRLWRDHAETMSLENRDRWILGMIARPWLPSMTPATIYGLQLNHRKPRNFLKRQKVVRGYHIKKLSRFLITQCWMSRRSPSISADT